ncbi:MAG: hypothetical protein R3358_14950, partial [Woeseiaceae bacterium]|nr:hypothetical protein [Woeseiaceae bacterium]
MTNYESNLRALAGLALVVCLAATSAAETPDTPEHVVGDNPYPFDTADPRVEKGEAIELPDEVADKLSLLTPEQVKFLQSGDARPFTGPLKDTLEALDKRTPEEVRAWVTAMQEVHSLSRYDESRDARNIPFNTASQTFNAWRTLRPRSMDPPREDGPVALGRYDGYGGPPTFGSLPLALTKADLVAGKVDVAIIGAPLNMGSGWRDSGERAPTDLRVYGWSIGSNDQYVQVNAGEVLNIVDYGD